MAHQDNRTEEQKTLDQKIVSQSYVGLGLIAFWMFLPLIATIIYMMAQAK